MPIPPYRLIRLIISITWLSPEGLSITTTVDQPSSFLPMPESLNRNKKQKEKRNSLLLRIPTNVPRFPLKYLFCEQSCTWSPRIVGSGFLWRSALNWCIDIGLRTLRRKCQNHTIFNRHKSLWPTRATLEPRQPGFLLPDPPASSDLRCVTYHQVSIYDNSIYP